MIASINETKYHGLYDPGSNVSVISENFLLTNKIIFAPLKRRFKTLNGEGFRNRVTIINLKLFNTLQRIRMYVVNSSFNKYELILGLDLIPFFKLIIKF